MNMRQGKSFARVGLFALIVSFFLMACNDHNDPNYGSNYIAKGDPNALYNVGLEMYYGQNKKGTPEMGLLFIKEAAQKGDERAIAFMKVYNEK